MQISFKAYEDKDKRTVRGWATRLQEDRDGDIVIPDGVRFKLPIPFLLDHDPRKAIGSVDSAEVTTDGISFVADVRKIGGDSEVARACDNAWLLLQHDLRMCVSVGYRALAFEPRERSGFIIKEWEWLELSAVTIPANPGAEITALKSYGGGAVAGGTIKLIDARATLPVGCFRLVRA